MQNVGDVIVESTRSRKLKVTSGERSWIWSIRSELFRDRFKSSMEDPTEKIVDQSLDHFQRKLLTAGIGGI